VPGHCFAWFQNEPANEGVKSFAEYFFFHDRLSLKYRKDCSSNDARIVNHSLSLDRHIQDEYILLTGAAGWEICRGGGFGVDW
jgi:hypothetical protein